MKNKVRLLEKIDKDIEDKKAKKSNLDGQIEALKEQLSMLNIPSFEKAQEVIVELQRSIADQTGLFMERMDVLEKKYLSKGE